MFLMDREQTKKCETNLVVGVFYIQPQKTIYAGIEVDGQFRREA